MLLYHLRQQHPDQVGQYLERMRTECIATVAAEAYEVVEEDETR
jgi:L-lactate utilization protein LutC